MLDAVVIARLSTGRIELWNPAAERLFGFSAQEAIGQSIEILMPEPIADVHRAGYERYLRTGHGLIIDAGAPVEMPARTKSGDDIRILGCALGHPCPRGPVPLPLSRLDTESLFLASCNGLRMRDGSLHTDFNLGLEFLDGR